MGWFFLSLALSICGFAERTIGIFSLGITILELHFKSFNLLNFENLNSQVKVKQMQQMALVYSSQISNVS